MTKVNAAGSGRDKRRKKVMYLPVYSSLKTSELRWFAGDRQNRLFFGSFFSTEKKEHVTPRKTLCPFRKGLLASLFIEPAVAEVDGDVERDDADVEDVDGPYVPVDDAAVGYGDGLGGDAGGVAEDYEQDEAQAHRLGGGGAVVLA